MGARLRALAGLLIAGAALLLAAPAQASVNPSATALHWAESHARGAPYSWGAAGPWSYDCSGLVMAAYSHAGVALPHYTVAMVQSGKMYMVSHPRPGDLAFWGDPRWPYHVELFVRPGLTFGARTYGEPVGFHSMSWFRPSSYWRIR